MDFKIRKGLISSCQPELSKAIVLKLQLLQQSRSLPGITVFQFLINNFKITLEEPVPKSLPLIILGIGYFFMNTYFTN